MKSIFLSSAAALLGTALFTQADAPAAIKNHVSALHDAKSFKAELTVQKLSGGGLEKETLTYSKDGMFKIDTPSTLAVSDGKMVWVLNKSANTYTEGPAALTRTKDTDVWAWAAFFNDEAFKGTKEYVVRGTRMIRGNSVEMVQFKLANDKVVTLYVDAKLGVARGLSNDEVIVMAPTMSIGKDQIDAKEFAFTAPAGAKKEEIKPGASFADVQKILMASCQGCHNNSNSKAGLSVESYDSIMKKVTPGDAAASNLYRSISGPRPKMPVGGSPLSKADQETIASWINAGAKQ